MKQGAGTPVSLKAGVPANIPQGSTEWGSSGNGPGGGLSPACCRITLKPGLHFIFFKNTFK